MFRFRKIIHINNTFGFFHVGPDLFGDSYQAVNTGFRGGCIFWLNLNTHSGPI
jgi:hypothetical protein